MADPAANPFGAAIDPFKDGVPVAQPPQETVDAIDVDLGQDTGKILRDIIVSESVKVSVYNYQDLLNTKTILDGRLQEINRRVAVNDALIAQAIQLGVDKVVPKQ